MVGWHHQPNEHKFEQTPGDTEGQGSLACCSPWGCKESDMTEKLNNNTYLYYFEKESCIFNYYIYIYIYFFKDPWLAAVHGVAKNPARLTTDLN